MRALLPYLALYKRHKWMLLLGVVLAIVTLLASIGLLTPPAGSSPLQRWWASPGSTVLTICCLPRAFAARQLSVPPGATLSAWSATTLPFACCSTCAFSPSANCSLSPAGLARFRRGELLNRVVADVDTRSSLPAGHFAAGRRAGGDCGRHLRIKSARRHPRADARRYHAGDPAGYAAAVLSRR